MLRLATKKVIVKRLSAVETLGGTNVIFTDKTGTLTQNRIEVNTIQLPDLSAEVQADAGAQTLQIITGNHEIVESDVFQKLVLISVLCNNADYDVVDGKAREVGDPVEVSLLKFAMAAGQNPDEINRDYPRRAEKAFSSDTRIMGTLHEHESRYVIAVKGAAEEILNRSTSIDENTRKKQYELSEKMAADGLRTLAFAYRETDKTTVPGDDFADNDLAYLGLIGFLDPPRTEVTPSLESCRRAGIKVIMVTGDHPATALAIASKVKLIEPGEEIVLTGKDLKPIDQLTADETEKLLNCRVFARVSPAQKLDMIELYQQKGHIVGMTGDGVNDAPALKKSDIGIAMGLRGTQVAAETADMVLKDDSFSSIVAAIAQGRVIFENIRKFVLFLLSCNLSEIFVVTFAGFLNVGTPLLPLQILFINIVTDVFPALALGVGRENASLMERPPRDPKTPIMDTRDWRTLVLYALAMTAAVLGTYGIGTRLLGLNPDEGNNLTFYALSFAQLMHVFNLHSERSFFVNEITRNRYIWYALIVCLAILAFTYFVPVLHDILNIQPMTTTEFSLILASGIAPVVLIQLVRLIVRAMK